MIDFRDFKPCFLIAMPELEDPHFSKTVVLLTDYQEDQGAFGFVINRPSEVTIDSIELEEGHIPSDYHHHNIHTGGPVEPEKIWLIYDGHIKGPDEDGVLGDGIKIAKSVETLNHIEHTLNQDQYRIFHGYAGWDVEQLEAEIAVSAWLVCPLNKALMFECPPDRIWPEAIRKMGLEPSQLVGPNSNLLN